MAVYDAWAAYDSIAEPCLVDVDLPAIEDPVLRREAQEEAINYASFRILWTRFANTPGGNATLMNIYQRFLYEWGQQSFQSTDYLNDGPRALGNYIAEQVLAFGDNDGSNEANDYANQHYEPVQSRHVHRNGPRQPVLDAAQQMAKHQPQHVCGPKWR